MLKCFLRWLTTLEQVSKNSRFVLYLWSCFYRLKRWTCRLHSLSVSFHPHSLMFTQLILDPEDEKISTDELQEEIAEFEDYVQSTDIAAMQSSSYYNVFYNPGLTLQRALDLWQRVLISVYPCSRVVLTKKCICLFNGTDEIYQMVVDLIYVFFASSRSATSNIQSGSSEMKGRKSQSSSRKPRSWSNLAMMVQCTGVRYGLKLLIIFLAHQVAVQFKFQPVSVRHGVSVASNNAPP